MKIFQLSDPRNGWIDITFGQTPDCYTFTASDVPNDCLHDLAAAMARLLRHSTDETVEFSLEPDFVTCRLHRDSNSVNLVLNHTNYVDPVFIGTFPLHSFAKRLRSELLRIEERYSAEDGWTQPFPDYEVNNLA